jgi:hypothetical protein
MSLLSWMLVILAGLSLAVMVVSLTISQRSAREARSTIFPIVREEETVRARRARIATSVTGVIAAIMAGAFFLSGQLPTLSIPTPKLSPEFVVIALSPATSTETPVTPSETPVAPTEEQKVSTSSRLLVGTTQAPPTETPLPPATATTAPSTFTPTPAPSATPTPAPGSPTATSSPIPAPASVEMGPIAFTTQVTARHEPISPTIVFSDTVSQVYATFPYTGMQNGLSWTQVWYFNGVEFSRGEESWEWGSADRSFVFTKPVGAGDYRLELYVNDKLVTSGEFTVRGPVAIGGPLSSDNTGTPASPERTVTPESP